MIHASSLISRIAAGSSVRVRRSLGVVAPTSPQFAGVSAAFGTGRPATVFAHTADENTAMNMAWLGGVADTGCAQHTYVAKRITTGRLCEGLT